MPNKNKKDNRVAISLDAELVNIKLMKANHVWRIEFDVYETDSPKVKELFDLVEKPVSLGIVADLTDPWE